MSAPTPAAPATPEPPISRGESQQLLAEALGMSEAEHTEVILEARREGLTRFANNIIHQNVTAEDHVLTMRAIVGGRVGLASTNRLDSSGLRQLADRALAVARLSPEDPDLPELAPAAELVDLEGHVPATAASTPEERAGAVGAVVTTAAARGLNAAGALSATSSVLAIANTRGVQAWYPETHAHFTCTVRSDSSSGWVNRHRRDVRALDVAALGEAAVARADAARAPQPIETGPWTVVLEPAAVAELVSFLALLGLGAQADQEGRSFLSGRLGERLAGQATVVDDAWHPLAFGRPFDYEGVPRRRIALIEQGVARAVVHDRRTARRAHVESTGHATAPPATDGPLPASLVLEAGRHTVEEMIASTERGILITRFWYNRVVDPRKTLVTGMSRDGTILIENGRLTRGLRSLRYNESVLGMLERVEMTGAVQEPLVFDYSGTCVVAPALKVREFHFTGISPF